LSNTERNPQWTRSREWRLIEILRAFAREISKNHEFPVHFDRLLFLSRLCKQLS